MKWFVAFLVLLSGCAKTAPQAATDAALQQVAVVEKQIKKECPQAKIDEEINTLKTTIKSQLSTCESELGRVEADKVKWEVAFFALLIIMMVRFAGKFVK